MSDEDAGRILRKLDLIDDKIEGHTARLIRLESDVQHINRGRDFWRKVMIGVLSSALLGTAGALIGIWAKGQP